MLSSEAPSVFTRNCGRAQGKETSGAAAVLVTCISSSTQKGCPFSPCRFVAAADLVELKQRGNTQGWVSWQDQPCPVVGGVPRSPKQGRFRMCAVANDGNCVQRTHPLCVLTPSCAAATKRQVPPLLLEKQHTAATHSPLPAKPSTQQMHQQITGEALAGPTSNPAFARHAGDAASSARQALRAKLLLLLGWRR